MAPILESISNSLSEARKQCASSNLLEGIASPPTIDPAERERPLDCVRPLSCSVACEEDAETHLPEWISFQCDEVGQSEGHHQCKDKAGLGGPLEEFREGHDLANC